MSCALIGREGEKKGEEETAAEKEVHTTAALIPSSGSADHVDQKKSRKLRKQLLKRVFFVLAVLFLIAVVLGLVNYFVSDDRFTRKYHFNIEQKASKVAGHKYTVNTVDGKMPGPAIHVRQGEVLSVQVSNGLADNGVTIHWHGLRMKDYQVYDGVSGLTQCPIGPGDSYLYHFRVNDEPGTRWYHIHTEVVPSGLDFIRGPLIVHSPDAPYVPKDSYHTGNERILFYQDLYPSYLGYGGLNGEEQHKIMVENGEYKFRIINGGDQYAYIFGIDGYKLTVVATDGHPVESYETDMILIHSGERYDVLINFNISAPTENVWIRAMRASGRQEEQILGVLRIRADDSVSFREELPHRKEQAADKGAGVVKVLNCIYLEGPHYDCHNVTELVSKKQSPLLGLFDYRTADFMEGSGGGWFVSIDGGTYTQNLIPQIPAIMTAAKGNLSAHTCILHVPTNKSVTIVLRNRSFEDHPMHLHGHHFEVLEIASRQTANCEDNLCPLLDLNTTFSEPIERLMRRSRGGVLKDTVIMPPGGAVVVRFNTDSPGLWFFHCHARFHLRDGMAFAINEGDYLFSQSEFPRDYPSCDIPQTAQSTCACKDDRSGLDVRCSRPSLCGVK